MPVTGRPREFDRAAALDAAMRLFWHKGYSTTSMDDLCKTMGIRSPSLYAAFGSKESLYREALQHYVDTVGKRIWDALDAGDTARVGVQNMLLAGTEIMPACDKKPAGCMATLGAVADEWPAKIAEDSRQIRLRTLQRLRARLKAAVEHGELPAATNIDRLSRFYLGVFQAMAVQARDGATQKELNDIAAVAMTAWPVPTPRESLINPALVVQNRPQED